MRTTEDLRGVSRSEGRPGEGGCCGGLLFLLVVVFVFFVAAAVGLWVRLGVWGLEVRPADGVRDEGVIEVRGAVVGRGGVALGVEAVLAGLGFWV